MRCENQYVRIHRSGARFAAMASVACFLGSVFLWGGEREPTVILPLPSGGVHGDGSASGIYGYKNAVLIARTLLDPRAIQKIVVSANVDNDMVTQSQFTIDDPQVLESFRLGLLHAKCRLFPVPDMGEAVSLGGYIATLEFVSDSVHFRVGVNEYDGFHFTRGPRVDKTFTSPKLARALGKALRKNGLKALSPEAMKTLSGEIDSMLPDQAGGQKRTPSDPEDD